MYAGGLKVKTKIKNNREALVYIYVYICNAGQLKLVKN